MNKIKLIAGFFLLVLSFTCFSATLNSLTKKEFLADFVGKTMVTVPLATMNNKLIDDSFSGYFNKNGEVVGKFAKALKNKEPQKDKGKWEVKDDGSFCIKWQHWFKDKEICMVVYELDNGYLFINAEKNKLGSFATKPLLDGNQVK